MSRRKRSHRALATLITIGPNMVVEHRKSVYGAAQPLFEHIACRWSLVLGMEVTPAQVALCLIDLKLARLVRDPSHLDSIVDVAGYAACLREVTRA